MEFSKSFGYAVRGVLYIAMIAEQKKRYSWMKYPRSWAFQNLFLQK